MASTWTTTKVPQFEEAIRRLTEQHRELKDEPLHLAMLFGPHRDVDDIFLLEVIGPIGGDSISPDRELFEVTYHSTPRFPMEVDQSLHLILTNPTELKTALGEGWKSALEIVDAVRERDYKVIYNDDIGKQVLNLIRRYARKGATHG